MLLISFRPTQQSFIYFINMAKTQQINGIHNREDKKVRILYICH